ncbi:Anaphase-promoting complex subunit 13 [Cytospora mali]|uniref:Anaphase-promoting complex subunit 13 n=1 Tax=Cytospora mali TaxID=578113 RepID=A0A194V016_CYTMA|nr:Anaphase-promoting complex subunit 13 [Valsa mali var. pyri (nom. inval.)]
MATRNNAAGPDPHHQHQTVHGLNWPTTTESTKEIDARIGRTTGFTMNKDSQFTSLHLHRARDADLFESFCRDRLPSDDIYVAAHHQPVNPEDEDDVVPDQHAAFGIQKATQLKKEPAWRDFGLGGLMAKGPGASAFKGIGGKGKGVGGGGKKPGGGSALPR